MEDAPKAERIIRITVVGDGYTGKTCLLIVYKDKTYNEKYIPTVFDSYSMTIPISGDNYKIILSDTAGQEDYDKLRPLAYNETDVFIICYSVDSKDSYDNVHQKWNKEIRHYKPSSKVILVATKIDLREVDRTRNKYLNFGHGEKLKRMINADDFVECSSKLMFNVNKVFQTALLSTIKSPARKQSRACVLL